MNKVWWFMGIFVLLIVLGILIEVRLDRFTEQGMALLLEAEELVANKQYQEATKKIQAFIILWEEDEKLLSWVAKQETLSPVSTLTTLLMPLLEEGNYAEFRGNCAMLVRYIRFIDDQEHISWKGIL